MSSRKHTPAADEGEVEPPLVRELGRSAAPASREKKRLPKWGRAGASTEEFGPAPVPSARSLEVLREAARSCRACPLWRNATCTVFGEGPVRAKVLFVGEQPGDQEDRAGQPFIGPAGQLLNRALEAAGLDRSTFYVTNAVKHFKWTPQGKRRLHAKPNAREMAACRPWLEAEIQVLKPRLIVCLGSTAAQQVVNKAVKVTQLRGQIVPTELGPPALITVHPSSLLRRAGTGDLAQDFAQLVDDLRHIKT